MADKKSFVMYASWMQMIDSMPDDKAGQLIKAVAAYVLDKDVEIKDPLITAMFAMIRETLDEDAEKYEKKVAKLRGNGKKGGEANAKQNEAIATSGKQMLANAKQIEANASKSKQIDGVSESVSDSVSVSVSDSDIEEDIKIRSPAEPDITAEVVDYLNQKLGTRYKADTEKTRRLIRARIREGATLEDFRKVIDKKVKEWRGTKLEPYLRPETLFGAKFESYLNQGAAGTRTGNVSFTDFEQRNYDYDALEKALEG
jgi:uncharacterized phage protein (TIGR02220 family)